MAGEMELIVATYINGLEADESLKNLQELHANRELYLLDVAVLSKDKDGKTTIKEIRDLHQKDGRQFGAIVGGILGIMMGPGGGLAGVAVGAAIGATAGAVTGGMVAKQVDTGVNDDILARIIDNLDETSSSILIIVYDEHAEKVIENIQAYEVEIESYDLEVTIKQPKRKRGSAK